MTIFVKIFVIYLYRDLTSELLSSLRIISGALWALFHIMWHLFGFSFFSYSFPIYWFMSLNLLQIVVILSSEVDLRCIIFCWPIN